MLDAGAWILVPFQIAVGVFAQIWHPVAGIRHLFTCGSKRTHARSHQSENKQAIYGPALRFPGAAAPTSEANSWINGDASAGQVPLS